MASTYVNDLGLEIMATGDQSGAWGGTTNTNLELIAEAFSYGTRAIANASTDNMTITNGASDEDRSLYLKLTGGGQACTITLLPNTISKVWIMENNTNSTLTFTQGSGANVAIPTGQTKVIATDGNGSSAIVYDVFTDLNVAGTLTSAGDIITAATVQPLGDTAADDKAALGYTSVLGAILTGQGSTNDVTLVNDADATVLSVPTGSLDVTVAGTIQPLGDTAAGDIAAIGYTDVLGLILTGQGSTNDVTINNDADAEVMGVATGATVANFASIPTVADVAIKVAGKESIWVPAGAMYPSTTNPCSDLTQVETTALRPDLKVLDFAAAADDFAQFSIAFPKSWDHSVDITYQVFWTPSSTNTDNCIWSLQGVSVIDNGTIDVAFGTAVAVTDAGIGAIEDQQVSAESGGLTIASRAADAQTYFQIFRDANAGGDTFSGVARLLGVKIFFTTNAANDA